MVLIALVGFAVLLLVVVSIMVIIWFFRAAVAVCELRDMIENKLKKMHSEEIREKKIIN